MSYSTKTKLFSDVKNMNIKMFTKKVDFTWFIFDPYTGEKIDKKFIKREYLKTLNNN